MMILFSHSNCSFCPESLFERKRIPGEAQEQQRDRLQQVSLLSCLSSSDARLSPPLISAQISSSTDSCGRRDEEDNGDVLQGCSSSWLPVVQLPTFSSKPLSMPLVSPTLAAVEGHLSTGPFHPSWCESTYWQGSLII